MLGNFYKSAVMLGNVLWMPVGILFVLSLLWCLWRIWRDRRDPFPWCVALCLIVFTVWRLHFHVERGRHALIFAIPTLFFCFTPIWDIRRKTRLGYILLAALGIACLTWSMRHSPEDRKMLELLRQVRNDSGNHGGTIGMSFTKHHEREGFYSGVEVVSNSYPVPPEAIFKYLDGNLRVWDGGRDPVYIFVALPRGMELPRKWLTDNSRTGKTTVLGEAWYDRNHKKRLAVLKYLPGPVADAECTGKLLPNGDFQALLPEAENLKSVRHLGRRAKRFLQPGVVLPQQWRIYHSLTIKSNAVATVVRRGEGNSLRMEANGGYLAAISPAIPLPSARKIGFAVYAETDAILEPLRAYHSSKGGYIHTILTLKLSAGTRRRYTITLPPGDGKGKERVWFWLQRGTVELSDIRLQ